MQDMPQQESNPIPNDEPIIPISDHDERHDHLYNPQGKPKDIGRSTVQGMTSASGCIVVGVLVFGICSAIFLIGGGNAVSNVTGWISSLFRGTQPQVIVDHSQTIFENLSSAGRARLETQEMVLSRAIQRVSVDGCALNSCWHAANFSLGGTVEAGVDLANLDSGDITFNELTSAYTITLPGASLFSCRIDEIVQQTWEGNQVQANWDRANQFARYTALVDWRDEAIERGILENAERAATFVMRQLIAGLIEDNQTFEIEFDPSQATQMHFSCNPSPPQGFTFSSQTNSWIPNS